MTRFRGSPEFGVSATTKFATEAERDAFIASFPKSVKLRPITCYTVDGSSPGASFGVELRSNGVNGGVNETGVKRLRRFLEGLDPDTITFQALGNDISSLDELNALATLKGPS